MVGNLPINHIEIPSDFVDVSHGYYSGIDDLLYAVSSTGGLTTGTNCPILDYTDNGDRDRKWYLSLWRQLSADIGYAIRCCNDIIDGYSRRDDQEDWVEWEHEEYDSACAEIETLTNFEVWVDHTVIPQLEELYGLGEWDE